MPPKKRPPSESPKAPTPPAPPTRKRTPAKTAPKSAPKRAPRAKIAAAPPVDAGPLRIFMVSSEAHPFAKTGGLAEVAGALPHALARLGHRVTLVVPRYRGVPVERTEQTILSIGGRAQQVGFSKRPIAEGVDAVLVDAPELFDREGLYGTPAGDYADNAWRFAVFSRAALEYVRLTGERPSVIHAHDWQTGLVPAYQKMRLAADPIVGGVPVVFTIHNLAFQGVFPPATLD